MIGDTGLIDTSGIDHNLQVLNGIQDSWSLPALPDSTKLDLASLNGVKPDTLSSFALGLSGDIHSSVAPRPVTLATAPTQTPDRVDAQGNITPGVNLVTPAGLSDPSLSFGDQTQRIFNGLSNLPPALKVDRNAVEIFKARAIEKGYLDQSTPIDASWDPALNSVRYKMLTDEAASRYAGNRPGATTLGHLGKFMDDWLTPTGLLKAAVDLNFLPSISRVQRHGSGFFGAISDFVSHPNLDSFKDIVGNGAGLIGDIAVPVVNDALLMYGVPNIFNFVRAGVYGAEGLGAAEGLYAGSKIARALVTDVPAAVERFGQPGLASKFLTRFGDTGDAAAGALNRWRELQGVTAAKGVVSEVGKLGIAGRIEHAAQGSGAGNGLQNIPGAGQTIHDYIHQAITNPLATTLVNNLLVPTHYFEPGTLGSLVSGAKDLGSAVSMAQPIKRFQFAGLTDDQALTAEFHDGIVAHLKANHPDEAAAYQQAVTDSSVKQALADKYAGGDTETLGRQMAYIANAAALDFTSSAKASEGGVSEVVNPDLWQARYSTYRNKSIAQLRQFDPDNLNQLVRSNAAINAVDSDGNVASNVKQQYRRLADKIAGEGDSSPTLDALRAQAADHNLKREGFQKELLQQGLQPGVLKAYMPQVMDSFGNWSDFVAADQARIEALDAGLIDDARYLPAKSPTGQAVSMFPMKGNAVAAATGFGGIGATATIPEDYDRFLATSLFAPLARPIDPSFGAHTVAGLDTLTKQDYLEFAAEVRRSIKVNETLRIARNNGLDTQVFAPIAQAAEAQGLAGIHQLDPGVVNAAIAGNDIATAGKNLDRVRSIVAEMRRTGIGDFAGLQDSAAQGLTDLDNSNRWTDEFGIPHVVMKDNRIQPLDVTARYKALWKKSTRIAAEVDLTDTPEHQALADALADHGYKMVHGVEFLAPTDLANLDGPMADIRAEHLRTLSLGNFFKPSQTPGAFNAVIEANQRRTLVENVLKLSDEAKGGMDLSSPTSPDMDTLWSSLRNIVNQRQELANANLEASRTGGIFSRRMADWGINQAPASVAALSDNHNLKTLTTEMTKIGYSPELADATWNALKQGSFLGWHDQFQNRGLYAVEDFLRHRPVAADALTALGGSAGMDNLLSVRGVAQRAAASAPAAVGAYAGYQEGGLPGAAAGGAAGAALGKFGAPALASRLDSGAWQKLAYLPDSLAHMRDTVRFSLNPIFDMHRAAATYINAHLAASNEDLQLPRSITATGFKKAFGSDAWDENLAKFRSAWGGDLGFSDLGDVRQAVANRGMLGFDPEAWMAAGYGFLTHGDNAIDPEQAINFVRDAYTHTSNRSAAEMSTNFVLFPFSYQKHVMGNMAKFISQDMGRAVAIHDGMAAYNLIDQHYDISQELAHHLPLIHQLRYANPFAYGLSAGKLGGINRPFLDLFTPMVFNLAHGEQPFHLKEFENTLDSLWTFNGEAKSMIQDIKDQKNVFFSPSHVDTAKETDEGFTAFRKLRDATQQQLQAYGYKFNQLTRNPDLAPINTAYETQRAELEQKYPAWAKSYADSIANASLRDQELASRTRQVLDGNAGPGDEHLVAFGQTEKAELKQLELEGVNTKVPEDIPADTYQRLNTLAVDYAKNDPAFLRLYKRFYAKKYGPVTREI